MKKLDQFKTVKELSNNELKNTSGGILPLAIIVPLAWAAYYYADKYDVI